MYLVVFKSDVVLEHGVPLLQTDLFGPRASLRSDKLLQIADRVILAEHQWGEEQRKEATDQMGQRETRDGARRTVTWQRTYLHLTRTFLPRRSLQSTSIILVGKKQLRPSAELDESTAAC